MPIKTIEDDNTFDLKTAARVAKLRRVAERKSRQSRYFVPILFACGIYEGLYGLFLGIMQMPGLLAHKPMLEFLFYLCGGAICTLSIPELFSLKAMDKSKTRLKVLVQELSADPRAVGPIAQLCLRTQYLSIAEVAIPALLGLLPRVTASDARYVSNTQMEALLSLLIVRNQGVLKSNYSLELPLAVLQALERIGDSRAIEPVKRLTIGPNNQRYRQAAQECLTILEQHSDARDYNRTLLVPTSVEVADTDTLLRATIPPREFQTELLLRAAASEDTKA